MIKVMVFIDGTWLYYGKRFLGGEKQDDFHIDYGALPQALSQILKDQLRTHDLDIVRNCLFGHCVCNYDPSDHELVMKQREFYALLRDRYHYSVEIVPWDVRGKKIKGNEWSDEEGMDCNPWVAVALTTSMMYYAMLPHVFDIGLLVAGNRDYIPLLRQIRFLGKRTGIVSIRSICCPEFADPIEGSQLRDFEMIYLDDLLPKIELKMEEHYLPCESPFHEGNPMVLTTFYPAAGEKFYCDECRKKYERLRKIRETEGTYILGDLTRKVFDIGTEIKGRVKTKFPDRGFGFLIGEDGWDYFFHASDLAKDIHFSELKEGCEVSFCIRKTPSLGKAGAATNVRLQKENELVNSSSLPDT